MEQLREVSNLGLELAVRKCRDYGSLSLMNYLREFHRDPVMWTCDSDSCEATRQLQGETNAEDTRGEKRCERTFKITQAPDILCIHLNRTGFSKTTGEPFKVLDDISFLEELDLSEFAEDDETSLRYRMYSVVAHRGPTVISGHYIAAVRHRGGQQFRTISDNVVVYEKGDFEELRYPSFGATGFDEEFDPVVLFYLRM